MVRIDKTVGTYDEWIEYLTDQGIIESDAKNIINKFVKEGYLAEITLPSRLATKGWWINHFMDEGLSEDEAETVFNMLLDEVWFKRVEIRRKTLSIRYYPKYPESEKGIRVGTTLHLIVRIKEGANIGIKHRLWGHLIYKPVEKAHFITGVKTLEEYLGAIGKNEEEQKRRDHPIALEFFIEFYFERELEIDDSLIRRMIEIAIYEIQSLGFNFDDSNFDIGMEALMDYKIIEEDIEIEEAIIRWSYDGESWRERSFQEVLEAGL